jgi:multidrug efflux pump subunit AcrA (membrane-fusion protein)
MTERAREYRVTIDGAPIPVVVEQRGNVLAARAGDDPPHQRPLRVLATGADPLVLIGGRVLPLSLGSGDARGLSFRGRHAQVRVSSGARAAEAAGAGLGGEGNVRAPMPGRVVAVRVRAGDSVSAGAALVVVEAMKMQNELLAPRAATIAKVLVKEGDAVERGATLVELS